MADLTNIEAVRNGSEDFIWSSGAATQTVKLPKPDEKFILIILNEDAVEARIRVSAGIFSAGVLGSVFKDIIQDGLAILGPFEGSRFKNVDGKLGILITGTDDNAFGGTIGSVKIACIELP